MASREHQGHRKLLKWAAIHICISGCMCILMCTTWILVTQLHGIKSISASAVELEDTPCQQQPTLLNTAVGCEADVQPEVAMLLMVTGEVSSQWEVQYWMAIANRRAYALQHGFPLYITRQRLGSRYDGAWEKLVALRAVMQHSCAQWLWMSDMDAYILELDFSVTKIIQNPFAFAHPRRGCSKSPDIITAGACLTPVNTGSVLWRNNEWTQQFVSDAWHSKWAAVRWRDQAVVLHLYNKTGYKDHFCIVTQHNLNAYPRGNCHDGQGTYKDGDFVLHFVGSLKHEIQDLSSRWLKLVPLMTTKPKHLFAQQLVFTIQRFDSASAKQGGRRVDVTLHSEMNAGKSRMPTDFALYVEPQAQQFDNWGWPLPATPAVLEFLNSRKLPLPADSSST